MEHRSRGGRQSGGLARAASSVVYSIDAWCAVCIVCVAVLAWAGRHQMNPDGLSYLDLGTEAANGGPGRLISGYWSPAYPALIAAVVAVFRPSAAAEFPAVHFLNFGIFLFTLWAFRGLAVEYLRLQRKSRTNLATPFAFSMLLGLMVWFVGPAIVTPDLLTAGIVFLACRLAWKLTPASSYWRYSGLGLLLAAAYYAKSAMFLIGVVLLMLLGAAAWRGRLRARGVVASATVFAAGCYPMIVMVSTQTGYATFGQSGSLNYVWYVNHRELTVNRGWTGQFGDTLPQLAHGPRVLVERPLTIEFAAPVPGTYPIWYGPDYWWAGVAPHFDLSAQLPAIRDSLANYLDMLAVLAPLVVGMAVLVWLAGRRERRLLRSAARMWPVLWPLGAFVILAPVHVEGRFVAPFFAILFLTGYRVLAGRSSRSARGAVLAAVCGTMMLIVGTMVARAAYLGLNDAIRRRTPDYVTVGAQLSSLGLRAGDNLAMVGYAFEPYYARYARMRVTAQIQDDAGFWLSSAAEKESVAQTLAAHGVKAIVAVDPPRPENLLGWREVSASGVRYFVRLCQ